MSIIHPNTIKAIAHSVDIPKLADDAAKTLAPDVEYRLREVVQEALKFAKHAKRTKLTTEDINDALRLRNVEPLFGFISRDPAKFLRVATHPDVFYVRDPELNYHELIETPLPKLPREAGVAVHWLAINGVQPELPENTPVEQPPAKRQKKSAAAVQKPTGQDALAAAAGLPGLETHPGAMSMSSAIPTAAGAAAAAANGQRLGQSSLLSSRAAPGSAAAVQLQLPVRHTLSRELQVYGDKLVGLLLAQPAAVSNKIAAAGSSYQEAAAAAAAAAGGASGGAARELKAEDRHAVLLRAALASVASDPGLHPLAPYLSAFIAEKVAEYLDNLELLSRLLQLVRALLSNPAVHLEPYLQQLLPAVLTCVVTRRMGSKPLDDHWSVRREAAALLAVIAAHFSAPHHNLRPRLCRVLAQAFLDASKPLTSKYGAVVGLQALGPQVVRTLLIPHLEPFMSMCVFPAMHTTGSGFGSSSGKPANDSTPAAGAAGAAQQHLVQQQQQLDVWQVYAALLSAVGGAMYDLLISQMKVPQGLVLARRGKRLADWDSECTKALLASRRPVAVRLAVKQDGQGVQLSLQVAGSAAAAADDANGSSGAATAGAAAADGDSSQDVEMAEANGLAAAGSGGSSGDGLLRGVARDSSKSNSQLSVAQVLGESWKEDCDVNATLGALMHLFGEDLLPHLPLAQLAAVSF